MVEPPRARKFSYRDIELYKSESLGSGSYGGVCKAKCDGLLCAAKIMHPTLFDMHDPGTATYLRKFREECHLLSLARHPNVVQYLATSQDPDTQLPVLLMEPCEESLTAFLEQSSGPLPYHIQVNICHDITLGLVYLHSNGVIHRDLTGNNVLIVSGPRAKITDFGMSKLAHGNVRMTALTLCPGNLLYMSPEALDEAKSYTAKLDIFSFGVIVIQILTRLFPNPTERFCVVYVAEFDEELRREIPEVKRRKEHLDMIPTTHALKPIAVSCLVKEAERPSAMELSEKLCELKQSAQYTESVSREQMTNDVQQLQRELHAKNGKILAKDRELQAKQLVIAHRNQTLEMKERELRQVQEQLHSSEGLISEFQQILQQKEQTISDLQQTISAQERTIKQLELQQNTATTFQAQQEHREKAEAATQKSIEKMRWRKGKNAPEAMTRGAVAVHENIAYFMLRDSQKVYSYQHILGEEKWSQLPDNPNMNCGLAVIDGLLTSVGGWSNSYTNTLLSLKEEGERREWSEIFPPMQIPRGFAACVTVEQAVVVAGGFLGLFPLAVVEVMNTNTKQWVKVSPLPQRCRSLSATVCRGTLYLTGGFSGSGPSKSVFSCSLSDILPPITLGPPPQPAPLPSQNIVWREISSLPVKDSTIVSFGGCLLAIGGADYSHKPTSDVYIYDSHTEAWTVGSKMNEIRSCCLALTIPQDCLIVVGGYAQAGVSVEILE